MRTIFSIIGDAIDVARADIYLAEMRRHNKKKAREAAKRTATPQFDKEPKYAAVDPPAFIDTLGKDDVIWAIITKKSIVEKEKPAITPETTEPAKEVKVEEMKEPVVEEKPAITPETESMTTIIPETTEPAKEVKVEEMKEPVVENVVETSEEPISAAMNNPPQVKKIEDTNDSDIIKIGNIEINTAIGQNTSAHSIPSDLLMNIQQPNTANQMQYTVPPMSPVAEAWMRNYKAKKAAVEAQASNQSSVNSNQQRPDFGRHKVDYPIQEKPKREKLPDDTVIIDQPNMYEIYQAQEKVKTVPDVITKPSELKAEAKAEAKKDTTEGTDTNIEVIDTNISNTGATTLQQSNNFSILNMDMFKNKPYLKKILDIMEKHNSVSLAPLAGANGLLNGLIAYNVFNSIGNFCPEKSFTIDTGYIIDRRAKLYPFVPKDTVGYGYDRRSPYHVLISKGSNGAGKVKKELNEKLFEDISIGGCATLEDKSKMFNDEIIAINSYVDLASIANGISNTEKDTIRKRILELITDPASLIMTACNQYSGIRFSVRNFNKNDGSFLLDSANTPFIYSGPIADNPRVVIEVSADNAKLKDNIN